MLYLLVATCPKRGCCLVSRTHIISHRTYFCRFSHWTSFSMVRRERRWL